MLTAHFQQTEIRSQQQNENAKNNLRPSALAILTGRQQGHLAFNYPPPQKNSPLRILANLSKSWKPTECITQGVTDCFSNIVQLTVRYLLFPVQAYCNWFPKFTFQSINYTSSCNYKLRPITRQMDSQTYTGPWLASAAECLSISWHCWLGDREGREPMRIYSSYPPKILVLGEGTPPGKAYHHEVKWRYQFLLICDPSKYVYFHFCHCPTQKWSHSI